MEGEDWWGGGLPSSPGTLVSVYRDVWLSQLQGQGGTPGISWVEAQRTTTPRTAPHRGLSSPKCQQSRVWEPQTGVALSDTFLQWQKRSLSAWSPTAATATCGWTLKMWNSNFIPLTNLNSHIDLVCTILDSSRRMEFKGLTSLDAWGGVLEGMREIFALCSKNI